MGSLQFFAQNRLPWQSSLRYRKKGIDRSSTAKKLSFDVKIAKIGLADLEIICLREIIYKRLCLSRGLGDVYKRQAKNLSFDVKIAKIGLADLEIICLREIIKKEV